MLSVSGGPEMNRFPIGAIIGSVIAVVIIGLVILALVIGKHKNGV